MPLVNAGTVGASLISVGSLCLSRIARGPVCYVFSVAVWDWLDFCFAQE